MLIQTRCEIYVHAIGKCTQICAVHLRIENLKIYMLPEIRATYKVLGRWIPPAAAQSLPTKTYKCSSLSKQNEKMDGVGGVD